MSTIGFVLSVLLIVVGIMLSIIILLQSKRSAGLGSMNGSSGQDTYWSKNKSNSMEGALEKYTKIFGALFLIVALLVSFFA